MYELSHTGHVKRVCMSCDTQVMLGLYELSHIGRVRPV